MSMDQMCQSKDTEWQIGLKEQKKNDLYHVQRNIDMVNS